MNCVLSFDHFVSRVNCLVSSIIACFTLGSQQPAYMDHPGVKKLLDLHLVTSQLVAEKAMAPHSSTLAWEIPWMQEPGRLQSMGSQRVGHNWASSLSLFTFMLWRRKCQATPVFLPGESQGWGSLVGCRVWGRTESDTTEWLHFHFQLVAPL